MAGNHERRHLNKGQLAVADSKRAKLSEEYAAAIEKEKAGARERQRKGGKQKVPQKFGEANGHDGEVSQRRAKAAGTNRQYIDDADKLIADYPALGDRVLTGELTLPDAMGFRKKLEAIPEGDRQRPRGRLRRLRAAGRSTESGDRNSGSPQAAGAARRSGKDKTSAWQSPSGKSVGAKRVTCLLFRTFHGQQQWRRSQECVLRRLGKLSVATCDR
jgi:hypothetical protein